MHTHTVLLFNIIILIFFIVLTLYEIFKNRKQKQSVINRNITTLCKSWLREKDRIQSREIYQRIYDKVLPQDKDFMDIERFILVGITQTDYNLMKPKIEYLLEKYRI